MLFFSFFFVFYLLLPTQRLRNFFTHATACIRADLRKGLRKPLRCKNNVVKHVYNRNSVYFNLSTTLKMKIKTKFTA